MINSCAKSTEEIMKQKWTTGQRGGRKVEFKILSLFPFMAVSF